MEIASLQSIGCAAFLCVKRFGSYVEERIDRGSVLCCRGVTRRKLSALIDRSMYTDFFLIYGCGRKCIL